MSILSEAVRGILAGQNPFVVFKTAATKAEGWGEQVKKQLSPEVAQMIDAEVAIVKQAASNSVMLAQTFVGPFLDTAADAVNTAFVQLASPYLGPFTGIVTKAEIDMVNAMRDHLKAQIDAQALALLAQRATPPNAPAH